MGLERFSDLTPAEALEISGRDPRVQLMERLYRKPQAKEKLEALIRENADLFPNGNIPQDPKAVARDAIKDDLEAMRALKAEIDDDKKSRRHEAFRQRMIDAGAKTADLDKIEQFMVDHEFGPKAVEVAVEKYYDAAMPAEPNATSGLGFFTPDDADPDIWKTLTEAPPGADLDQIAAQHYENVFAEMTKGAMTKRPRLG